MDENITLRQWIKNYDNGLYDSKDRETQIKAGWYDWFCRDTSLANKTKNLAPKVKQIAKSSKVNQDTMYVFFKNNCPMVGSLYDDFRFCDIETGDVVYTIVPKSGFKKSFGKSEVFGRENDFNSSLTTGTWKEVISFFNGKIK